MADNYFPSLHTVHLTKPQQNLCNTNPTYRSRIAELHDLLKELLQIRKFLLEKETGKLPGPNKKRWSLGGRKREDPPKEMREVHELDEEEREMLRELEDVVN